MPVTFRTENQLGVIEFNHPDSKVNLLTADCLKKLDLILEEVKEKEDLKAILLVSGKKDVFIAGADIKEIEKITQTNEGEDKAQAGQKVFNKLEDLKVPTIAVINGVALGGGCELALACRYRIGTFNPKVRIGLPEVNLGILPGFGGTYRLPKTIGLSEALKIILAGKVISGMEAYKIGLLDRLFPQVGIHEQLLKFIDEILSSKKTKRNQSRKGFLNAFLEKNPLGRAILFDQTRRMVLQTTKGFYPVPLKALEVIKNNFGLNRNQALKAEAKGFSELVIGSISKNLVKVFYLTEKFKKYMPPGTENILPKRIDQCAVIGAGVMGGGIAQLLTQKGVWVRMKDIDYKLIGNGLKTAEKIYKEAVKKRKLKPHEVKRKMAQITTSIDYSGFKSVDMVIEAVVENLEIKNKIFKEFSNEVSDNVILCTNTSSLPVSAMAQATRHPANVVGFHFFNPVHRMPLIEVIKTPFTSAETLATAFQFARRLDKTPILVNDSAGFLINRILLIYINEAGRLLEEGWKIQTIDQIMTDFGMPMGPLTLSDEVGLDVGIKVLHILEQSFGARFKAAQIFERVYSNGLLGKKMGKGFYIHPMESRRSKILKRIANKEIEKILGTRSAQVLDHDEARKRMLYLMVNEAAMCLEEKIVEDVDTVDLGMIMGTGFPPFQGGLIRYAQEIGIDKIIEDLNTFQDKFKSDRFKLCAHLANLA